jgi:eukaryotic-like serine/threonine-protein kinase
LRLALVCQCPRVYPRGTPLRHVSLTEPLESLKAALTDRYTLERELGRGGMATVYLAHDLRHDRSVALKVLHPDLTATLGPDRFQREIRYAARLQHPHILTVLDSGESGGQLWFTMPYVEGESLRERLTRDRQLSLEDALRIGREAAQALQYAHEHDVLHRDIKPENLLLTRDGNTLVADFGVARALASEEALTQTGLTVGTPAYMSPEQAAGERQLDARSDIYSLGCVLYEMLCGEPPFTGPTAQAIMAKRFSTSPTPVRVTRPEVPAHVDDVVQRALARTPADRFASAGEMAQSLRPSVPMPAATRVLERAPARHQEGSHRTRWLVAGGLAALTIVAMVAFMRNHERPVALDRGVIAVAPFRVTGADSSLGYLREGMVDLLSTKLSGTAALRPADPRTLLAAWGRAARGGGELPEDDAVRVAAALGAGRMVEGEVVGSRSRVSLSARILDVPSGSVRARATAEGPPDSLTQLVDHLSATLLALGSGGEAEQRLAGLTSTSLSALRAYLDGEALLRRGRFGEASKKFFDAFQIDSTFALAGVGTARADEWQTSKGSDAPVEAAWRHRDRLSARDLARLTVDLGPRYPAHRAARDRVETAERLVELAPDSPDAWYKLADGLFHNGALASIPEALPRAVAAFARSLALDSTYAPTLQHLTEVAALLDDTAGVLRGRALLRRIDSASSFTIARLLHPAVWLGDTAEVRRLLASDSALNPLPTNLLVYALEGAVPLDTGGVEDLYRRAYAQAATAEERKVTALIWSRYELASGRPGKSPPLSRDWPGIGRQSLAVLDGLFADGDSRQAAEGARSLERQLGSRFAAADRDATLARYAVGQYNLKAGNLSPVRLAIADLRQAQPHPDSVWQADEPRAFALLLGAQLDAREGSPEAPKRLRQLDSVLANPQVFDLFDFGRPPFFTYGNLVAARLHEEAGDTAAALAALRRRVIGNATFPLYVRYRREEGRLAASVGDTAGAIRAYRHYLALRSAPEPRLRAQADTVRIELAELLRAAGRH